MNMEQIMKLLEEKSILVKGKPFQHLESTQMAMHATAFSGDDWFRSAYMLHLNKSDAHSFTFEKETNMPHIVNGRYNISVWIFPEGDKYFLMVYEYSEGNKRYPFTTEEELTKILIELGLDRKN